MKNEYFKDTRLLESLDYIDSDLIGEVAEKLHVEGSSEKVKNVTAKKNPFKLIRQVAAIAACALLMGALIPVVSYVSGGVASFLAGSSGAGENSETESLQSENETNMLTVIYDGSEGLEYVVNPDGKSASFIGFGTCTDEHIVIASTYNGLPVTEMRNEAFLCGVDQQYCGSNYAKSITVSDTVESIYQGIFELCPYLESIYIGTNVNWIRPFVANTLEGYNLAKIEVSPHNKYFTDNGNCLIEKQSKTLIVSCKNSVIPADGSVEIIGSYAFAHYPQNSIVIPEGIKRIELMAFTRSQIESVVLPKSLEFLGANVFDNCNNLKIADLNGFTELSMTTFNKCYNLIKIIGIENVTHIGDLP